MKRGSILAGQPFAREAGGALVGFGVVLHYRRVPAFGFRV